MRNSNTGSVSNKANWKFESAFACSLIGGAMKKRPTRLVAAHRDYRAWCQIAPGPAPLELIFLVQGDDLGIQFADDGFHAVILQQEVGQALAQPGVKFLGPNHLPNVVRRGGLSIEIEQFLDIAFAREEPL